jgi:coenzyme PQQ precursor peptide PqqA
LRDFNPQPGPGAEETSMKNWKKPQIREICLGMEINSYASATLAR